MGCFEVRHSCGIRVEGEPGLACAADIQDTAVGGSPGNLVEVGSQAVGAGSQVAREGSQVIEADIPDIVVVRSQDTRPRMG